MPTELDANRASMASRKQLGELLKEQQEPFTLEVYLLERGCKGNNFNLERSFSCCSAGTSSIGIWNLKRSSSSLDRNRRPRKVIPNCSRIAKAVVGKIVSIGNSKRKKNAAVGDGNSSRVQEICRSKQQTEELDRFSSASSATVFNSCSDGSDTEEPPNSSRRDRKSATADPRLEFKLGDLLREEKIISGRKLGWRCRGDNKQLSPVSVLEEIGSKEESPVHNIRGRNARTGDSILAIPFCKFIVQSSMEEKQSSTDPLSHYLASKRVSLQQSKQRLFDYVREKVEIRVEKNRRRHQQQPLEFLGPGELGQLLYEDVRSWNKLSGNKTKNTTQLMNSDFTAPSVAEWIDFEPHIGDFAAEIADGILLHIISKEIVLDMIEIV